MSFIKGVYSSAPISTVTEGEIGRVSPSISTVTPTVLSPASFASVLNVWKSLIERKAGDLISTVKDGRSRPGYLLVQGKSRKECEELIEKITSLYKVEYEN